MATKRRRRKKKGSLRQFVTDERFRKISGLSLLLIALYLFVAFTSYLFTWKTDQDQILRFSWDILWQANVEMANWLGRLGAIVSNAFFYWLYGLPSFVLVFLIGLVGIRLIQGLSIKPKFGFIGFLIGCMLFGSVILEFSFGNAQFPWGGAFGEQVSNWLYNFVGNIGCIALFAFIIVASIIWVFNPSMHEMWTSPFQSFSRKGAKDQPVAEEDVEPLQPIFEQHFQEKQNKFSFDLPEISKVAKPKKVQKELGFEIEDTVTSDVEDPMDAPKVEVSKSAIMEEDNEHMVIEKNNIDHSEPYDPTKDLSHYTSPPLELLEHYADQKIQIDRAELERNKDQIIETLLNYKIEITKIRATIGPTVTLYEIVPAAGVRISKIKNLEDDIALSLSALGIRIIAPIPGRGTIGIEVPNKQKQIVSLREVIRADKFTHAKMDLPIALGKTINNEVFVADLAKMPHLLIAGATGQGKSVGINTILCSLLYKKHPSQLKLVLIDPKKVELFPYAKLESHFLAYLPGLDEPIVTDTTKVVHTLNSLIIEMEERYNLLKKAQARNIKEYNEKFTRRRLNPQNGHKFLPFIVLVIDEFADLIMTAGKEVELPLGRLAQLSRAVGIHLIIATQRPSVNIITGVIKANFPARIAFKVTAKVDSRTIIDTGGADRLIGRGDMLLAYGSDLIRLQCAFIDTPEVEKVISHIADQQGYPIPYFLPEFKGDEEIKGTSGIKFSELDEMFDEAARLIVQKQLGSTSMIQRNFRLGYNRAGRIMDQLEALGIVGPSEGSKARDVLIYDEVELQRHLETIKNN